MSSADLPSSSTSKCTRPANQTSSIQNNTQNTISLANQIFEHGKGGEELGSKWQLAAGDRVHTDESVSHLQLQSRQEALQGDSVASADEVRWQEAWSWIKCDGPGASRLPSTRSSHILEHMNHSRTHSPPTATARTRSPRLGYNCTYRALGSARRKQFLSEP